jgi:hypothetical protein
MVLVRSAGIQRSDQVSGKDQGRNEKEIMVIAPRKYGTVKHFPPYRTVPGWQSGNTLSVGSIHPFVFFAKYTPPANIPVTCHSETGIVPGVIFPGDESEKRHQE